jgi:hypothetical protein
MPISMKTTLFAFFICVALFLIPEAGISAKPDSKIVTRIDIVTATIKHGKLVVYVQGVGRTPAHSGGSGQLLRHNQKHEPNKDELLEYDLYFNPPPNYSGYTLKPVKATLQESSAPPGVKGVRIYAELNEMDAMLPEPKRGKPAPKIERIAKTQELASKKQEPVPEKEESAPKRKEPALTKEKPALRKEEATPPQKEEKEKKSWWSWNPFHRKPASSQVNAAPPESKKPEPAPKKEEKISKKEELAAKKEPTPKKEERVTKKEETAPQKEETRKKSRWSWNPFHRKPAASQVNAVSPESKKPEPAPKREEKTSKKEELAPKKEEVAAKKEPTPKKEERVTKKEETPPKKEETKKKSRWRILNPSNWNPFHRKPAEPEQ